LQLDKVESNGNLEIRKARKSAVCIQQMLTDLENKAKSNTTATETDADLEGSTDNAERTSTNEPLVNL